MKNTTKVVKEIANTIYDEVVSKTTERYEEEEREFEFEFEFGTNQLATLRVSYSLEVTAGMTGDYFQPNDPDDYEYEIDEIEILDMYNANSVNRTNLIDRVNKELVKFQGQAI